MPVIYDSIHVENLPTGGDAYLAYADGNYSNVAAVKARFPNVPVYALSVLGSIGVGVGVDTEPGNVGIAGAAAYIKGELARGVDRPIGYTMQTWASQLVEAVTALGVPRSQWRLLTAHYAGQHVCGPASCGLKYEADGTQWNNPGPYDVSLVSNTFILPASHPGVIVTPQDIANVVAAVQLMLREEFSGTGHELHDRIVQIVQNVVSPAAVQADVVAAVKQSAADITADVTAAVAASLKALPANTVSLKGATATISFT